MDNISSVLSSGFSPMKGYSYNYSSLLISAAQPTVYSPSVFLFKITLIQNISIRVLLK